MMELIYKENIIDHYQNPRNKIVLEQSTHQHTESNPICGDQITIMLQIEDQIIKQISFQGHGCAISQASISLLTEHLKNKSIQDAQQLQQQHIRDLLGIEISYTRIKCAFLSLQTLKGALQC